MLKIAWQFLTAVVVVGTVAWIAPTTAQFAPDQFPPSAPFPPPAQGEPEDAPPAAAPPAAPKQQKKAAPAGPSVAGTWTGNLTQVGGAKPYQFEISITGRSMETKYPDLGCVGKLTRVGSSRSYVFFIEIIGQGQAEKGGRCPDGTITVARQGDGLALGWFGSIHGETVVAYGTLKKK